MKKNRLFIYSSVLIGLVAALNFGCKKSEAPAPGQNPATGDQKDSAIVSAEKTSFSEVTSNLMPVVIFISISNGAMGWTVFRQKCQAGSRFSSPCRNLKMKIAPMLTRLSGPSLA
ncbi:MAG: hypothetical protein WDM76_14045 [Limisphaerales bacterium]